MSDTEKLHNFSALNPEANELIFEKLPLKEIEIPYSLFDPSVSIALSDASKMIPIIVCKKETGYLVIDGCKRLLHLKHKGAKETIAVVIDKTCSDSEIGMLRILLNRGRTWQLREKIKFIKWSNANYQNEDYRQISAETGISDRERHEIEQLFDCDETMLNAIDKGELDISVAGDLKRLGESDICALLKLFATLKLTRQQQRELLEWLPEIAYSESVSVEQILAGNDICCIVNNEKINPPQKAQKLRDKIYERRFPNLVKVKKEWNNLVNKVNPDPSKVHFTASEAFEKNKLEVRITLNDAKKAVSLFEKFGKISEEAWRKMIYPGEDI